MLALWGKGSIKQGRHGTENYVTRILHSFGTIPVSDDCPLSRKIGTWILWQARGVNSCIYMNETPEIWDTTRIFVRVDQRIHVIGGFLGETAILTSIG
jgi:hypothetical protein